MIWRCWSTWQWITVTSLKAWSGSLKKKKKLSSRFCHRWTTVTSPSPRLNLLLGTSIEIEQGLGQHWFTEPGNCIITLAHHLCFLIMICQINISCKQATGLTSLVYSANCTEGNTLIKLTLLVNLSFPVSYPIRPRMHFVNIDHSDTLPTPPGVLRVVYQRPSSWRARSLGNKCFRALRQRSTEWDDDK